MVQVSKESYTTGRYAKLDRFSSYYYQVQELLATRPESIFEVGVGDAVVSEYFRKNSKILFTTSDFAADLKPDVVADVRELPVEDNAYDTTCAFQVLEHLPFEDFEKGVSELIRIARNYVLISLPHFNHPIRLNIKVPLLPELKLLVQIPHPKPHVFDGQHYWEIGKQGYPASRIRTILSKHGTVEKEFVPYENPAHRFFVLKKR
jgi:hypothetical protein